MKNFLFAALLFVAFSLPLRGQEHDIELGGGYQHSTGDQGLDGFTVGAGWNPVSSFGLFFHYDGLFDTSTLGSFELTKTGQTSVHSHMQNWLVGPRIFMHGALKNHGIRGHVFVPFVEAGFGDSNLKTEVSEVNLGTATVSDTAFAWMLGGGIDLRVVPHFTLHPNLDFLRTHFANQWQSRVRFGISVVWSRQTRGD